MLDAAWEQAVEAALKPFKEAPDRSSGSTSNRKASSTADSVDLQKELSEGKTTMLDNVADVDLIKNSTAHSTEWSELVKDRFGADRPGLAGFFGPVDDLGMSIEDAKQPFERERSFHTRNMDGYVSAYHDGPDAGRGVSWSDVVKQATSQTDLPIRPARQQDASEISEQSIRRPAHQSRTSTQSHSKTEPGAGRSGVATVSSFNKKGASSRITAKREQHRPRVEGSKAAHAPSVPRKGPSTQRQAATPSMTNAFAVLAGDDDEEEDDNAPESAVVSEPGADKEAQQMGGVERGTMDEVDTASAAVSVFFSRDDPQDKGKGKALNLNVFGSTQHDKTTGADDDGDIVNIPSQPVSSTGTRQKTKRRRKRSKKNKNGSDQPTVTDEASIVFSEGSKGTLDTASTIAGEAESTSVFSPTHPLRSTLAWAERAVKASVGLRFTNEDQVHMVRCLAFSAGAETGAVSQQESVAGKNSALQAMSEEGRSKALLVFSELQKLKQQRLAPEQSLRESSQVSRMSESQTRLRRQLTTVSGHQFSDEDFDRINLIHRLESIGPGPDMSQEEFNFALDELYTRLTEEGREALETVYNVLGV